MKTYTEEQVKELLKEQAKVVQEAAYNEVVNQFSIHAPYSMYQELYCRAMRNLKYNWVIDLN